MDEKAHPYGWAFFSGGFWLAEAHWTSRLSLFLRMATILARRLAMDPFGENRPNPIPSQTETDVPTVPGQRPVHLVFWLGATAVPRFRTAAEGIVPGVQRLGLLPALLRLGEAVNGSAYGGVATHPPSHGQTRIVRSSAVSLTSPGQHRRPFSVALLAPSGSPHAGAARRSRTLSTRWPAPNQPGSSRAGR